MKRLQSFLENIRTAAKNWADDNVFLHSSSLAYYTVFSIAPLLVLAIAIAGFIFGQEASQGKIFEKIQGLIGTGAANAVQTMVQSASTKRNSGIFATILSLFTLLLGASGVFQQLQQSLNMIWQVEAPTHEGIRKWLHRRFLTFAMIGVIGLLLLISLIINTMLSAAGKYTRPSQIWQIANFIISIIVVTGLFASIYKFLPDVKLKWRNLWMGSLLTATLFSLGKWLIGLYIARSSVSSSYGAAGSLVVLLMWVYYSSMIVFFGAEFIKAVTLRQNQKIEPKPGAKYKPNEMDQQKKVA